MKHLPKFEVVIITEPILLSTIGSEDPCAIDLSDIVADLEEMQESGISILGWKIAKLDQGFGKAIIASNGIEAIKALREYFQEERITITEY